MVQLSRLPVVDEEAVAVDRHPDESVLIGDDHTLQTLTELAQLIGEHSQWYLFSCLVVHIENGVTARLRQDFITQVVVGAVLVLSGTAAFYLIPEGIKVLLGQFAEGEAIVSVECKYRLQHQETCTVLFDMADVIVGQSVHTAQFVGCQVNCACFERMKCAGQDDQAE